MSSMLVLCLTTVILRRYAGGPSNNLSYWGLDYPPLTAYQVLNQYHALANLLSSIFACTGSKGSCILHSDLGVKSVVFWVCALSAGNPVTLPCASGISIWLNLVQSWLYGKVIGQLEPSAIALQTSHGYETPSSKLLMRWSVVASDIAGDLRIPAVLLACEARCECCSACMCAHKIGAQYLAHKGSLLPHADLLVFMHASCKHTPQHLKPMQCTEAVLPGCSPSARLDGMLSYFPRCLQALHKGLAAGSLAAAASCAAHRPRPLPVQRHQPGPCGESPVTIKRQGALQFGGSELRSMSSLSLPVAVAPQLCLTPAPVPSCWPDLRAGLVQRQALQLPWQGAGTCWAASCTAVP